MTPKLYTALKWGALLGGPLALLEALMAASMVTTTSLGDVANTWFLSVLLESLIPLIAGVLAGRATGERRSGLIAGLTAAGIVAVVNIISEVVLPTSLLEKSLDLPAPSGTELALNWIAARVITLALGAWFGWLGGRLSQFRPPSAPPR